MGNSVRTQQGWKMTRACGKNATKMNTNTKKQDMVQKKVNKFLFTPRKGAVLQL